MKKLFLLLSSVFISLCMSAQFDNTQIYLVGDASPSGWDNNTAPAFTKLNGTTATFSWAGQLKVGQFKFLNHLGSWDSFNPLAATPAVDGQTYTIGWGVGDEKFNCTEAGNYRLTVDLVAMTMKYEKVTPVTITDLWAIGTAVSGGKIKVDKVNNKFVFIGGLSVGSLKFISTETEGAETEYIYPKVAGASLNDKTIITIDKTASAEGWNITVAETECKITIDILSETFEKFQPWSELYIVGGATRAGWDAGKGVSFTQDPINKSLFTIDDTLRNAFGAPGESNKFKMNGQKDWKPRTVKSVISDENILVATSILLNPSSDNKWTINKDGRYIISVNLLHETINAIYVTGVSGINVNGNDISIDGGTSQMSAEVLPADATFKNVSWSVDDESIATIDADGLLTAIKDGTVTVTATTKEGAGSKINGTKQIVISNQIVNVTAINVAGNDITTNLGTSQMSATIEPNNASNQGVTWTVDDELIATISADGLLTAVRNGTVTVTATTK